MTDEFGESVLAQTEVLQGTWEYGGTEYALKVEDISEPDFNLIQQYAAITVSIDEVTSNGEVDDDTLETIQQQAENIDNFSWEDGDTQTDFLASVINEKLVKPGVDPATTGIHKLRALFEGMMETWQEEDPAREAKEAMPLEGNR